MFRMQQLIILLEGSQKIIGQILFSTQSDLIQAGGIYVIWGSVDQYLDYFYTLTSQGDIFGA